jgi:hypothetical protein
MRPQGVCCGLRMKLIKTDSGKKILLNLLRKPIIFLMRRYMILKGYSNNV